MKQTEARLQEARDFAESVIATIREPLVVLDGQLRVVSASRSFYETFGVAAAETQGRPFYEIGRRQWDIPALRQLLEEDHLKNAQFDGFRIEHDFPAVGHKALLLNARQIDARQAGPKPDPAGDGGHHGSVGSVRTTQAAAMNEKEADVR